MKAIVVWLACSLVLMVPGVAKAQQSEKKTFTVGVVVDGPSQRLEQVLQLFVKEIQSITRLEFDVRFPPEKKLVKDYQVVSIDQALDQLLADKEVNLVLAHGVVASALAAKREQFPKPCIAPFVIRTAEGAESAKGTSKQRENLSEVIWSIGFDRDLRAFNELGHFKRLAWVYPESVAQAVPELLPVLKQASTKAGVELLPIPAGTSSKEVLKRIPSDVDGVYVGPNPQLDTPDIKALAQGLIERRLPSYSWLGRSEVELGLLAGISSEEDLERLARRIALNVQSIILGEKPNTLVTAFKRSEQLVINMKTARSIGLWPNFSVLTDAVLLGDHKESVQRRLSLETAIQEALKSNLDLRAMKQKVAVGREEIRKARANLLPQLTLSASAYMIDKDRAGLGNAERTAEWGGSLRQAIINEPAWANLSIQKSLSKSLVHEERELRLEITHQTALAYLNLLSAQTIERIQRENLALSRDNLALARVRHQVGTAGPGEVLRWDAQIAAARSDLIAAVARRNQAEILVNRLLNRPLEEPFVTREATLEDPALVSSDDRFRTFLENPLRFKILREFLVEEGIKLAPELKRLDAITEANRRRASTAKRSLYIPRVGLSANITHQFYRGGAGSQPFNPPPGFPPIDIPNPDSVNWFVGVSAELPLYEGGARYSEIAQSDHEYTELQLQKQAVEELIAQRLRSSLHQVGADFAAIRLSGDAAKAAQENLKLVTDAYSRGTASIVQLLDAQNQALVAQFSAANSVYRFLATLMDVERGVGSFNLFSSSQKRTKILTRLEQYERRRSRELDARPATDP